MNSETALGAGTVASHSLSCLKSQCSNAFILLLIPFACQVFDRLADRVRFETVLIDEAAQASELANLQAFAFGCKRCVDGFATAQEQTVGLPLWSLRPCRPACLPLWLQAVSFRVCAKD